MGNPRAAIYCRISDDRESRRLGVERQEADGRALAERLGYQVTDADVLVENDISASTRSSKRRPLFEQMLKACEDGTYQALIAYSSSRLTRRPLENERLIALYEKHGILIHYVNTNDNDLSTARGRRRARDDAARDAEYAEELSENVKRAALGRAKEGRANGGTRPFGWSRDDRRVLDPYEHRIKVWMKDSVLAGASLHSIVRELNEQMVPTVTWHPPLAWKQWAVPTVREMLTNWRQCGLRVYKDEIVGKGDWEPAFDEATVQQLREILLDKDRRTSFDNRVSKLVTGLAVCDECSHPVAAKVRRGKGTPPLPRYHCKTCGLWRSREPIDDYVSGYMVALLESIGDEPDEPSDPGVAARIKALQDKITETEEAFAAADDMTPADLLAALRPLKTRLRDETRNMKRARHPAVNKLAGPGAAERWESADLGVKRAAIAELVEIRIKRGVRGRRGFDPASVVIERR